MNAQEPEPAPTTSIETPNGYFLVVELPAGIPVIEMSRRQDH
jgi:hypothetical protein